MKAWSMNLQLVPIFIFCCPSANKYFPQCLSFFIFLLTTLALKGYATVLASCQAIIHSFISYIFVEYLLFIRHYFRYCRGTINKVPVLTKHMLEVEDRKINKDRFVGSSITLRPYIALIMVIAIFNSITFI